MDPPYRKTVGYAVGKFTDDDYKKLASLCKKIKGKFLVTLNDDPYIRDLFSDFEILENGVKYSIMKDCKIRDKVNDELIIKNY
ncbi:MAG: hypothetical protein GX362_03375 [Methanosarcinaceae archaeon]|nr:hypothetical protein [Methanosarcinaceae archaeon]